MAIKVRFLGRYRQMFQSEHLEWAADCPMRIRELLEGIAEKHGCRDLIFDGPNLRPYVNVTINNRYIIHLNWLDTEVKDGDAVTFYDPATGG
jgi:molybdopterin converting factor small subunit